MSVDAEAQATLDPVQSPETEEAVLSACFLSDEHAARVALALDASDFATARGIVFETISALVDKGAAIEVTSVAQHLKERNRLEAAGGVNALSRMMKNQSATPDGLGHYIGVLREKSIRRRLVVAAETLTLQARNESLDLEAVATQAEVAIRAAGSAADSQGTAIAEAVEKQLEIIRLPRSEMPMVPTGIKGLDDALGGGMRGGWNVVVLAAPGHGKTAFAIGNGAVPTCQDGGWALIGTQEMTEEEVSGRCLASCGAVTPMQQMQGLEKMSKAQELDLEQAAAEVRDWPMRILGGCTVQQLRLEAERMAREHSGLGCVVLDYLQITPVTLGRKDGTRTDELEYLSRSMKAIARDLGVVVMTLSQPTASASRSGSVRASDGKGAQAIQADADAVIIPWRSESGDAAKILLDKFRHGRFPVRLEPDHVVWDGARIRFGSRW